LSKLLPGHSSHGPNDTPNQVIRLREAATFVFEFSALRRDSVRFIVFGSLKLAVAFQREKAIFTQ
jgi:hypothetical protein